MRALHPGADENRMELALEQWSFSHAKSYLESEHLAGGILSSSINLDVDLANLLTIFRFVHAPAERRLLHEWLGEEDVRALLLGPGTLSFDLLEKGWMQEELGGAIEIFAGTVYEGPLRDGVNAYAQSGRLSELERHLLRFRLNWRSKRIGADPLGIGTVLGYAALKVNEVQNLGWIAQGVSLSLSPHAIRASMELVS
jgi:vacuolar-type H+-ATPase subunit C/Vma6